MSLSRYLKPPPLCSTRVTGRQRYYGWLRLPRITARVLAFYTCSRVPTSGGPIHGSPWLPQVLNVRLDTASDPGEYPRCSPLRNANCCLPGGQTRRHSPTTKFSGLNTFRVGSTRYLCTSPAFAPTHRHDCYHPRRKARYWARGARLPRRDSHPLEHAALPGRTDPFSDRHQRVVDNAIPPPAHQLLHYR